MHAPALGALVFTAFAWGLSWWPLRELRGTGLHALWATTAVYAIGLALLTLWRPRAWSEGLGRRGWWLLALASGATNAAFNWAVTIGDVVRVVLLFYLMPLWTVPLARLVLHERMRPGAWLRLALALAGAMVVLWPEGDARWPLPRSGAEWLGLAGGFALALTNVMLRREAASSEAARSLALFAGGAAFPALLAFALLAGGQLPAWPAGPPLWLPMLLALTLWFLAANLALQYGAARLPANVTAVVMLSEVLFASVSAVLLGAGSMSAALLLGGALIVGAALLAARDSS
jgi:drug/metabolite transporter (DMT)-like permease